MKHLEASNLLTEFVARALPRARHRAVERHVERCEECSAWVTAYLLFGHAGAGAPAADSGHLSSHELSLLALAPEGLASADMDRSRRHAASCDGCDSELGLVRDAVAEAREEGSAAVAASRFAPLVRIAWAAGLLIAIGAVAFFGFGGGPVAETRQVQGETIDDARSIEATESIFVEATSMRRGSAVKMQAGRAVAFGNGFSIESGARLDVRLSGSRDSDADS